MSMLGTLGEGLAELTVSDDGQDVALAFGGDAANIAVMAARAGASVRLGGRVGEDALGDALVRFWSSERIDTSFVVRDPQAATGLYVNERDRDGSHRFVYWRAGSAGSRLCDEDVGAGFLDGLSMLVVTGITLAISETARAAANDAARKVRRSGGQVAFVINHRPALQNSGACVADFAASADVLIGSREDAEALFSTSDPAALREHLSDGPTEIVLTDEHRPAWVIDGNRAHCQTVPVVTVANGAGAGDALAGAYLAARLARRPPAEGLRWGVTAASLSVTREGCARSYPVGAELERAGVFTGIADRR